MRIEQGVSLAIDAAAAVAEVTANWIGIPDLILAFSSPVRPLAGVATELARRFPGAIIAGCSTAGEHLDGHHYQGGLVAIGLSSSKLRAAAVMIEGLGAAAPERLRAHVDELFTRLAVDRDEFDPHRYFCLLFVDGLAGREEAVVPHLADALDGVPLVGGSAGDDMAFRETQVMCNGRAATDAATLVLVESDLPFEILKHQHFAATPQTLAITRADPARRRVYEFDGRPAARAYCDAVGVARGALTDAITFEHPLTFACDGQLYVRSIQQVHDDDSITFYCAIEEGMVVDVAAHDDLVAALDRDLAARRARPADLMIGCNCILRALETSASDRHAEVGAVWNRISRHAIGFDTYGEQLDGLHINQTLVGVALTAGTADV
jgi:hypothetical protein